MLHLNWLDSQHTHEPEMLPHSWHVNSSRLGALHPLHLQTAWRWRPDTCSRRAGTLWRYQSRGSTCGWRLTLKNSRRCKIFWIAFDVKSRNDNMVKIVNQELRLMRASKSPTYVRLYILTMHYLHNLELDHTKKFKRLLYTIIGWKNNESWIFNFLSLVNNYK